MQEPQAAKRFGAERERVKCAAVRSMRTGRSIRGVLQLRDAAEVERGCRPIRQPAAQTVCAKTPVLLSCCAVARPNLHLRHLPGFGLIGRDRIVTWHLAVTRIKAAPRDVRMGRAGGCAASGHLRGFARILRSLRARRSIPEPRHRALSTEQVSIRNEVKVLRKKLGTSVWPLRQRVAPTRQLTEEALCALESHLGGTGVPITSPSRPTPRRGARPAVASSGKTQRQEPEHDDQNLNDPPDCADRHGAPRTGVIQCLAHGDHHCHEHPERSDEK